MCTYAYFANCITLLARPKIVFFSIFLAMDMQGFFFACMSQCICIFIFMWTQIWHIYIYATMYICIYVYTYTYVYTYIYMYVGVGVNVGVGVYNQIRNCTGRKPHILLGLVRKKNRTFNRVYTSFHPMYLEIATHIYTTRLKHGRKKDFIFFVCDKNGSCFCSPACSD